MLELPKYYYKILTGQTQNGDLYYDGNNWQSVYVGLSVGFYNHVIRKIQIPKEYVIIKTGYTKNGDLYWSGNYFIFANVGVRCSYYYCLIRKSHNRIFIE